MVDMQLSGFCNNFINKILRRQIWHLKDIPSTYEYMVFFILPFHIGHREYRLGFDERSYGADKVLNKKWLSILNILPLNTKYTTNENQVIKLSQE